MIKWFTLGWLLLVGGSFSITHAQIFIGIGAKAQYLEVVENLNPGRYEGYVSLEEYSQTLFNVSPALQWELVVKDDFFVSSSLSYLWTTNHRRLFPRGGFVPQPIPVAIYSFSAIVGQVSMGYAYKQYGIELGVEGIQSMKAERRSALTEERGDPIIFDEPSLAEPFLHVYPRLALSYKYGDILGVFSGTFRQSDFIRQDLNNGFSIPDYQDWKTAPHATMAVSIFYVWKASSGPASTKARF